MLGELGQKIEWFENLKVALHARLHSIYLQIGERPASLLLGLIDDLARVADLDQSRQTERTTSHVLDQPLDARCVARRKIHRLIDTETAVRPTPHVLNDFRFDLLLRQVQLEDGVPPVAPSRTQTAPETRPRVSRRRR